MHFFLSFFQDVLTDFTTSIKGVKNELVVY